MSCRLRIRPILIYHVHGDRSLRGPIEDVGYLAGSLIARNLPVSPVHHVLENGIGAGIEHLAQGKGVHRPFIHRNRSAEPDRGGHVADFQQKRRYVLMLTVLVDQRQADSYLLLAVAVHMQHGQRRHKAVCLGLGGLNRLDGAAVAPVDQVMGDRILSRVVWRADGQREVRSLVAMRRAAQGAHRRNVRHAHQ